MKIPLVGLYVLGYMGVERERKESRKSQSGLSLEKLMRGRLRNKWVLGYKSSILFQAFSF